MFVLKSLQLLYPLDIILNPTAQPEYIGFTLQPVLKVIQHRSPFAAIKLRLQYYKHLMFNCQRTDKAIHCTIRSRFCTIFAVFRDLAGLTGGFFCNFLSTLNLYPVFSAA